MDANATSESCAEQEYASGVRLIVLNLPEDEGEGLGFRLTRTLWDPYPWVREVISGGRADTAGLKMGDCLLQADGKDLLGLPVGQVAGLIRGDGAGRGVSLLVWNCGVDPKDDPELLWSVGGGSRGERSRRALAGVVRALACAVCAATATAPLTCARSHLYCEACWARLERCALCREPLPPKESPYARNLIAEQVFEAIATEYEIKNVTRRLKESSSAFTSPNRSPNMSPSALRKGQYQLSMMNRKKVQFNDKFGQTYASDPNIHRSSNETRRPNPSNLVGNSRAGNSGQCHCQTDAQIESAGVPKIMINEAEKTGESSLNCPNLMQHKLVARVRHACSLADLQNSAIQAIPLTRSLNNLDDCKHAHHSNSLDNLKNNCGTNGDAPVFLLSAPPIYVVACDHGDTKK